ncbi:MAG: CYTH domain-containing protein [Altibacter sp.]|uniref:CYTH domain-containing protein n=1 Tax=Altibacter sp. TaxID=2024823 RepID=UPI001DC627D0|nr:CYTH domain-containing protein [Altibacter sp.]MBZ0326527.1 CYTH domain-containing protein [Altibacter sp.]
MIEIERKFLVTSAVFKEEAYQATRIVQGFLNTDPERTVRIRIKGNQGFLTVKGKSNHAGTIRTEWETEINVTDAETLLKLCEETVIEKIRHEVKIGSHIFEVDEFLAENQGLIIAEIELGSENEPFEKPSWLGKEVTGKIPYYNSQLSKNPYKNWKHEH